MFCPSTLDPASPCLPSYLSSPPVSAAYCGDANHSSSPTVGPDSLGILYASPAPLPPPPPHTFNHSWQRLSWLSKKKKQHARRSTFNTVAVAAFACSTFLIRSADLCCLMPPRTRSIALVPSCVLYCLLSSLVPCFALWTKMALPTLSYLISFKPATHQRGCRQRNPLNPPSSPPPLSPRLFVIGALTFALL